jgi:hypothetical protein
LIARDNKTVSQNRISKLSPTGAVTPLAWPGTPPQDLESLAVVPGVAGRWATLTSDGAGTIFSVSGSSVVIDLTFTVPNGTSGIEGLAFARFGTTTVAVWSTRGSSTRPAQVHAATFDPSTGSFGDIATAKVTVPYPTDNARQISDLTLVGTALVASSASDPGANGPFDSAVYKIGTVAFDGIRAVLTMQGPQALGRFPGHKIEGIACSGTAGLLGTDDENQGGWIATASFCTS